MVHLSPDAAAALSFHVAAVVTSVAKCAERLSYACSRDTVTAEDVRTFTALHTDRRASMKRPRDSNATETVTTYEDVAAAALSATVMDDRVVPYKREIALSYPSQQNVVCRLEGVESNIECFVASLLSPQIRRSEFTKTLQALRNSVHFAAAIPQLTDALHNAVQKKGFIESEHNVEDDRMHPLEGAVCVADVILLCSPTPSSTRRSVFALLWRCAVSCPEVRRTAGLTIGKHLQRTDTDIITSVSTVCERSTDGAKLYTAMHVIEAIQSAEVLNLVAPVTRWDFAQKFQNRLLDEGSGGDALSAEAQHALDTAMLRVDAPTRKINDVACNITSYIL